MAHNQNNARNPLFVGGPANRTPNALTPSRRPGARLLGPVGGAVVHCPDCFAEFTSAAGVAEHQRRTCGSYNAVMKINNGYRREFDNQTHVVATLGLTRATVIEPSDFMLLKQTYGLQDWHIVSQPDAWSPYVPFVWPAGQPVPAFAQQFNTLDDMYRAVFHQTNQPAQRMYPATFTTKPLQDGTEIGYARFLSDPVGKNLNHEIHRAQEQVNSKIVCKFIEANGLEQAVVNSIPNAATRGLTWQHTHLFHEGHPNDPGRRFEVGATGVPSPTPVYVPMDGWNHQDRIQHEGVEAMLRAHMFRSWQIQLNPTIPHAPRPPAALNMYLNMTPQVVNYNLKHGIFNLPATPR